MQGTAETLQVKLAVYMERLDNYIESQTALNRSLCERLEKVDVNLDEIHNWRNRFYGAKWITGAVGILILHTSVVLSSILAMMRWMR